jgi:hypothetical protein
MPIILKDLATRNTIVRISSFTVGSATAIAPAGGETVTITGTGFTTGLSVLVASTSVVATVVNSTTLTFTSPANTAGNYNLTITNADGTSATKASALLYFAPPSWSTAAGALPGSAISSAYTTTITATGGTIIYSITSGSLPTGLTLNGSNGVISGTTTTTTGTSTFTVTATNQFNQTTTRSFSILVASAPSQIDYVMVAGGGGGGVGSNFANQQSGGGGGAGGYLTGQFNINIATTYTITVGTGGLGGLVNGGSTGATASNGDPGNNSTIAGSGLTTITAYRGGGGGSFGWSSGVQGGQPGGSGSGASGGGNGQSRTGGAGVYPGSSFISEPRQGYDGGANSAQNAEGAAGGGGGAGGPGATSTVGVGGNGGVGVINPFAVAIGQFSAGQYYLAGGGAGSSGAASGATQGTGGLGGGGNGRNNGGGSGNGNPGTNGTGGGGGGVALGASGVQGGRGGDGVVILRYPVGLGTAASTTGSPTTSTDATYRYYVFTTTGTITW